MALGAQYTSTECQDVSASLKPHITVHDIHLCRKTTVLSCHRCLINTGFENNEQHFNIDNWPPDV